jgi:hypothetical protein
MQIQTTETSLDSKLLEDELLEGEELLWAGSPDPRSKNIVSPARVFFILGSVFLPVGLVLLIVGAIVLAALYPSPDATGSLGLFIPGGVFLLQGLGFLIAWMVNRLPSRKILYGITNRRVIIMRTGSYLRVVSYNKRAITQVQRIERADGSGDLIFGTTSSPYSYYNSNEQNYSAYRLGRLGVFNAIPSVRLVEQKLLKMLGES